LIQQLATVCERGLLVQNLSLQTDSTDLLGGYKPLDMKTVARKVYSEFVDIFVSTFSRKQNLKFLKYASSMLEKLNWKKLSQCFQRAAQLGTAKMAESSTNERTTGPTVDSWNKFSKTCERFERQRLSCDAGLAFAFSEGVLVDAITHGKWYVSVFSGPCG
jgi:midasin